MLPITKTIPKELLPVGNKPVIEYTVEWLVSCWVEDIIVITSQSKKALEDYFDKNYELEELLRKKWKLEYLEMINRPKQLANMAFIKQEKALWTWQAVGLAERRINDDYFFINYWDEIYNSKVYKDMVDLFQKEKKSVMMLCEVDQKEVYKYWVVEIKNWQITNFVEKPKVEEAPSNLIRVWVWIFHKDLFKYLKNVKPNPKNWEIYLTDAILELAKNQKILPYINTYERRDIWSLKWRLQANKYFLENGKLF